MLLNYINVVTGWNMDLDELFNVGFRTLALQRLLLLLGGPDVIWIPEIRDDNPERI